MRYSLRNLLFAIFSGFLLIIALSLTLNQATINAHSTHNEALSVLNQMRLTLEKILREVTTFEGNNPNLSSSKEKIDQELRVLKDFGESQDRPFGNFLIYPKIPHDDYIPDLNAISTTWSEFNISWSKFSNLSPADPDYAIAKLNMIGILTHLFAQVDTFSSTLENLDDMQDKNQTGIQILFLGCGLFLLALGSYVIIFRVIRPLGYLDTAMREIGQIDSTPPSDLMANDELGRLARTFGNMRMEIYAAQKLLEDRVDERTRILTDAFDFSQEIVSQPDFSKLVDSVTQRAKKIMRAKSANLCFAASPAGRFDSAFKNEEGVVDGKDDHSERDQLPFEMIGNVQNSIVQGEEFCSQHQLQLAEGCCLSAPLHLGNRQIGVLCIFRDKDQPFTEIERLTLTLLANSAAVAIANIRLIADSRRQAEFNATLAERQRLTSELHDEAAQTLSLLNLRIGELDDQISDRKYEDVSEELEQFIQLTERAQAQMRMAFSGMNTPATEETVNHICDELTEYVNEFSSSNGIPVELVIGDFSSLKNIPAIVQTQLMYVYREALTNIERYANANKVRVGLERVDGGIEVMISDDGRGFDTNLSKSNHHLGLAIMQIRIERVGGVLSVESTPGAGTKVFASIPISAFS
ncbi:MAG: GAF domain-containing protein [Anaerolineales bacterium]|nr:GAF domain-containing protein [Anaerolineales bacterium]